MTEKEKIGIGTRVGLLTVEEKSEKRKNGYAVWLCRCDCGGQIELDTRCLQRQTVRDCGCQTKVRHGAVDLTGQRFGRLICLSPTEERDNNGSLVWLCRCDCGNTCLVPVGQLRSGYKKSCGCLGHPPIKKLEGKRFGRLTVLSYAGKVKGLHRWHCLCDCGQETVVGQTSLLSGKTKSCGCLARQQKKGEAPSPDRRGLMEGTCVSILLARMNKPPIASNNSGYNGVYQRPNGTWAAQITFQGKTHYLGSFPEIADAVAARKKGEMMYEEFLDRVLHTEEKEKPASGETN